jgi:hypothetical protein
MHITECNLVTSASVSQACAPFGGVKESGVRIQFASARSMLQLLTSCCFDSTAEKGHVTAWKTISMSNSLR